MTKLFRYFPMVILSCLFYSCEEIQADRKIDKVVKKLQQECGWNISSEGLKFAKKVENKSVWVKPYARCVGCEIDGFYFQDADLTNNTNSFIFLTCNYNSDLKNVDSTLLKVSGVFINVDESKFAPDVVKPYYFVIDRINTPLSF